MIEHCWACVTTDTIALSATTVAREDNFEGHFD